MRSNGVSMGACGSQEQALSTQAKGQSRTLDRSHTHIRPDYDEDSDGQDQGLDLDILTSSPDQGHGWENGDIPSQFSGRILSGVL